MKGDSITQQLSPFKQQTAQLSPLALLLSLLSLSADTTHRSACRAVVSTPELNQSLKVISSYIFLLKYCSSSSCLLQQQQLLAAAAAVVCCSSSGCWLQQQTYLRPYTKQEIPFLSVCPFRATDPDPGIRSQFLELIPGLGPDHDPRNRSRSRDPIPIAGSDPSSFSRPPAGNANFFSFKDISTMYSYCSVSCRQTVSLSLPRRKSVSSPTLSLHLCAARQ